MSTVSGDDNDVVPTLNRRFERYLDNEAGNRERRRLGVLYWLALTVGVVASVVVVLAKWHPITLVLAIMLALTAAFQLLWQSSARRNDSRLRSVVRRGTPVTAHLVQANVALFEKGPETLPGVVLFSLDPVVNADAEYLNYLARRVYSFKAETPEDADGRYIASLTADAPGATRYRRRKLPLSFTDGSTIYCADLWIRREYLENGYLTEPTLLCIAEKGDSGGLELVPSSLATVPAHVVTPVGHRPL